MALFIYQITKAAGHYHEIVGWDSNPLAVSGIWLKWLISDPKQGTKKRVKKQSSSAVSHLDDLIHRFTRRMLIPGMGEFYPAVQVLIACSSLSAPSLELIEDFRA